MWVGGGGAGEHDEFTCDRIYYRETLHYVIVASSPCG